MRGASNSVVEPENRESRNEIKLPPGAGAKITNYGSGSFLFTTNLKKFINKIMVGEEAIVATEVTNKNTSKASNQLSIFL